jgi:NADP-dependent 3-hydroxy acid dehydrogenase YdfG
LPKPLAVITGASAGIGEAIAGAFARDGRPVLLMSRHISPIDEIAGTPVMSAQVDVADAEGLAAAVAAAETRFGPTEVMVNNAGLLRIGAFETRDPAAMSEEIDVLLKGVAYGVRAVLPGMVARRSGTIVNMSSIGDRKPGPSGEIYHACKAAVRSLSESLQAAQAKHNVRVINVAPGLIRTRIHEEMGISFEEYDRLVGHPHYITADELAEIVLFCVSRPQHICIRDIVVMPTDSAF